MTPGDDAISPVCECAEGSGDPDTSIVSDLTLGSQPRPDQEQQPGMAAEAGFDNPMYGTGALQEGFGVPPARSAPSAAARSRLDPLPLVSKIGGMLRSLRFNVATQKLEEAPAGTGSDVNDNEKPSDDDQPLPAELGYDVPATAAADGKGAKKKRGSRKSKKGERQEQEDVKHRKMEEEDSTDAEEDLTGKTARKLAKQMGEKGFGNPCYELGQVDGQPVTTATATPTSESAAAAAAAVRYRTGFANPMFEETEKAEVTLKVADAGDSHSA